MYDKFLEIIFNDNLQWLVITGIPTDTELRLAWLGIIEEYCDLIKTPRSKNIFECWAKIEKTQFKIRYGEMCLAFLEGMYDEEIALSLVEFGFDFVAYSDNDAEYERQLESVENEIKTLFVRLAQLEIEYKTLCPDEQAVEIRNPSDYEKDIAILQKFYGYRIVKSEHSVFEIVALMNLFIESNQKNKK